MPQGWDLGGAGWIKNFSLGICDGAPSTAHSSTCNSFDLFSVFLRTIDLFNTKLSMFEWQNLNF